MGNQDNSNLRRLKILTKEEIRNLFELPEFTLDERQSYFVLTETEKKFLEQLHSLKSKLFFILQLGYFKARQQFFTFEIKDAPDDAEYILHSYFSNRSLNFKTVGKIAKNTRLNQQQYILRTFRFQWCGKKQRTLIEAKARKFARISVKPIYIFREIISFLLEKRIVLPGYSLLQDVVGQALSFEQDRLSKLLKKTLKSSDINLLEKLLSNTDKFYEITQLRREPKDFNLNEIKQEIERAKQLCSIYEISQKFLPKLKISNQSIAYYSSLILYYSVYKLKRFDQQTIYLYLLCFVHQRYQRVNDNLINSLIYRLRQYSDQSKEAAQEKLVSIKLETVQNIGKVGQVLKLMTDQNISPETPFGEVRQKAFQILSPQAINQVAEHIAHEKRYDEMELRWEFLDKISQRIKLNLRPILIAVNFSAATTGSNLIEAIDFLKRMFVEDKPFQQIPSERFPTAFIPETFKRYLYQSVKVDKKPKKKKIIPDRYEFLVYRLLRDALEAGEIYCRDSIRFRSFEDDLIDDISFQNKKQLIEQVNLPIFKDSINHHLELLKDVLEDRIEQVNRRIIASENKDLVFKSGNNQNRWVLEYQAKSDGLNESFFDSIPQENLSNVLRFVHWQTGFLDSFEHLRGRYVKKVIDETIIIACLMAWGTNIGLGKMGDISDINYQILKTTSDNFIRPETLQNANDKVVNEIARFPLFRHYDIDEVTHSSSDGQKYETKLHTFNSRHSPKYFGLQKGVVAYTLVANHIPVNARVIGANEHESHYVFDLLFNNTTNVQSEIHSTDTHGTNQVNFALLHLFGYQFAPRYKDIYDTVTKSLYGFRHPGYYKDLPLKPIRKINTRLIISEWENIERIILSLALKETTQSIIIGKLSSYARKNKTKRALWEYNNIIKSLYLLDYVDSPPLRRNVHQALNRGENYHQLKRTISYANFGKLRFRSEYEQNIWNECSRLLTNCILYYNIAILSNAVKRKEEISATEDIITLKQISPMAWQHINFLGRYEFGKLDSLINIEELVGKLSQFS